MAFTQCLHYLDETGEGLAGQLRAGNAGANTAADQIQVAEQAIEQIPVEHVTDIEILLPVDSAGASHELLGWCREAQIRYSVGYQLSEPVRAAIVALKEESWRPALDQDDTERDNGQVAEATHLLDLSGWPEGSRVLVRRERPHPGAQLSFTDHDGHRFQVILTDHPDPDLAQLERQPAPARASKTASATTKTPAFRTFPSATSTSTPSGSRSCCSPTT